MQIYDLKLNGLENPVGMELDRLVFSWKVKGQRGKVQRYAKLEVSRDPDFSGVDFVREGPDLDSMACEARMELAPRTRYCWRVSVETEEGERETSRSAFFETGKREEPWKAEWITTAPEDRFHPEFEKKFPLRSGWKSARLYISGLGLFQAYLNGEPVGEDRLAPFNTDYRDGVQYCTYEVTELLKEENTLDVLLGNGWYKGRLGFSGQKEVYGDRFMMIAELHVSYEDGSETVVATDGSWNYRGSVIAESDIYDGEIRDELLWENQDNPWRKAARTEGLKLEERYSLPLKEHERIPVREVVHTPAGETVLDFGQNFAGYVEFESTLSKGQSLRLQYGEILQDGNFYRDNYRSARAEYRYRSDGAVKTVRPLFTYCGFRYVKVETEAEIRKENFTGVALYSDVERTGNFRSSHAGLNRLYENTVWGLKSNFMDLPTDCPQRDERLGWTGDAQVFSAAASYHMDTRAFYRKFLKDLRRDQEKNGGKVAMFLPNQDPGRTASVWGDAAAIIPMVLYHWYGDRALLEEEYPLMRDWVEYIHGEDVRRGERDLYDFGDQLGDWLALDGLTEKSVVGATDVDFIGSLYYCHSAELVAQAAEVLGKREDAEVYSRLSGKIRSRILEHYFTPSGRLAVDTQTAYYLSITFGIYRTRSGVVEGLRRRLKKDGYQIRSGFAGAPIMCNALAEAGLEDIACDFLFREEYPGWLYEVNMGATTVWERWNSVLPDGHISDTGMNSLNHYAYGSVAEFMYRYLAGIQALEPGFRKARIAPVLTSHTRHVECSYDSAAGLYRTGWDILPDGRVRVEVQVPFGCTAELRLPSSGGEPVLLAAGEYEFCYQPERDYRLRYTAESCLYQLNRDPEALEIIEKECPGLRGILNSNHEELLYGSLEETVEKAGQGRVPDTDTAQLEKAVQQILALKAEEQAV